MPVAAGWLFATAMQSVLAESFRGLSRFGYASVFQTFASDLLTVAVLGAVFVSARTIHLSAAIGLLTAVAAMSITGLVLARTVRHLHGPGRLGRAEMFKVARPLIVTNVGIYLLGHGVDLWILGAFQSAEQVSLYGAAAKLVVLVATPMVRSSRA